MDEAEQTDESRCAWDSYDDEEEYAHEYEQA